MRGTNAGCQLRYRALSTNLLITERSRSFSAALRHKTIAPTTTIGSVNITCAKNMARLVAGRNFSSAMLTSAKGTHAAVGKIQAMR